MLKNDETPMKENYLRAALKDRVLSRYLEDSSTIIIDELGLNHNTARVDLAVINGIIHGYEIKSDYDTLQRLPLQIEVYNSVLDRVTLVTGRKHLAKASAVIPKWWGIKLAEPGARNAVRFTNVRNPKNNPQKDVLSLARLLWREEALNLLEEIGAAEGVRSKSRASVYARLAEAASAEAIHARVLRQLKGRTNWRSV